MESFLNPRIRKLVWYGFKEYFQLSSDIYFIAWSTLYVEKYKTQTSSEWNDDSLCLKKSKIKIYLLKRLKKASWGFDW